MTSQFIALTGLVLVTLRSGLVLANRNIIGLSLVSENWAAVPGNSSVGVLVARNDLNQPWRIACTGLRGDGRAAARAVCSSLGKPVNGSWSMPAAWLGTASTNPMQDPFNVNIACLHEGGINCQILSVARSGQEQLTLSIPREHSPICETGRSPVIVGCGDGPPRPPPHAILPLCREAAASSQDLSWCASYAPLGVSAVSGLGEVHIDVDWPPRQASADGFNLSVPSGT